MPRTEHLNNISPNRIYALDAQVLYKHQTPRMTTAIIEQQNVQSCIKIPHTMAMEEHEKQIMEGSNYHFGFCYINPNGWISVRHPDKSITQINDEANLNATNVRIMELHDIVNNCQALNNHYLTTILYVVSVNPVKTVNKDNKQLTLCVLNCYASGYLVDLTLWNSDLPINDIANNWVVFSGIRLKKLADWKFVFVSSVYSRIAKYEGAVKGIPYLSTKQYHNLSNIFEHHTVYQVNNLINNNDKIFSEVDALLSKMEPFTYEGCSGCRKKINQQVKCLCNPENQCKIFTILKITLESEGSSLEASVFDEQIQNDIMSLPGPTKLKFNLKSSRKFMNPQDIQVSHIVSKAAIL